MHTNIHFASRIYPGHGRVWLSPHQSEQINSLSIWKQWTGLALAVHCWKPFNSIGLWCHISNGAEAVQAIIYYWLLVILYCYNYSLKVKTLQTQPIFMDYSYAMYWVLWITIIYYAHIYMQIVHTCCIHACTCTHTNNYYYACIIPLLPNLLHFNNYDFCAHHVISVHRHPLALDFSQHPAWITLSWNSIKFHAGSALIYPSF